VTSSLQGRSQTQPTLFSTRTRGEQGPPTSLLWTPLALLRWSGILVVALVVIVSGWFNISGKDNWNDQVAAMNLAIASLVVAQAAGIGLLLAGRRTIGLRRIALLGEASEDYVPAGQAAVGVPSAGSTSVVLVGEAGRTHYHRADCAMAAGRDWPQASELDLQRAGLTPCGVCRP
jgi:hypothetical protein